MAPYDLTDAFNDCVDRLHAGQSIDDCLRSYPQHATILRPLLETAEAVRRANPVVPAAVRARVRARVMESSAYAPRHRLWPWSARVTLAAASFATVIAVAVLLAVLNRQPDRRLHIVPLPTGSPTATLTLTAGPPPPTLTATPSPTATVTAVPSPPPGPAATVAPGATATVPSTPASALPMSGVSPAAGTEASPCQFTVDASSANLRSGPGTGYTGIGYGYAGEEFPVTTQHSSGLWFQVQADSGEAWIAASVGHLGGDCAGLPVSDTPLINSATSTPESGVSLSLVPGDGGGAASPVPDGGHDSGDDGHESER
jgi:uncharacterized protein YraI